MISFEHDRNVQSISNLKLAEVWIDSGDLASRLRKQSADKKKGVHDFGGIWLANSVTQGTRVRVEILKAMTKCFAGDKKSCSCRLSCPGHCFI
jgi:hypothetical protein